MTDIKHVTNNAALSRLADSIAGQEQQRSLMTNDVTQATKVISISGEAISFSAGAIGLTGTVVVTYAPIHSLNGAILGTHNDTSFAFVTGTVLTTEIEFNPLRSDTVQLAALSNGEYAVDYASGKILYKKATTGTSDTCNYKYRAQEIDLSVSDIEIGAVELKDGTTDARQAVKVDNATATGTPTVALVGGIYKTVLDTYDDNDASPFHMNVNGELKVAMDADIEIGAVEIKDGTTDARQAVKVDNATATATPTIALTGGIYKDAFDTYADNDAAPVHMDVSGQLIVNPLGLQPTVVSESGMPATPNVLPIAGEYNATPVAFTDADAAVLQTDVKGALQVNPLGIQANVVDESAMPVTPNILPVAGEYRLAKTTYTDGDATVLQSDKNGRLEVTGGTAIPPYTYSSARGDFTATYTSNVTITLAGVATLTNDQLAFIRVTDTAGTATLTFVNGASGVAMSVSSNVITITGAGTPFASGDTYDVGINLQDKGYDANLDSMKTIRQNMEVDQYVEESIVDTTNVATGTYYPSADGSALGRYNNLMLTGKLIDGAAETTTMTVELTNDEDSTTANRDWVQIYGYDAKNNTTVNSQAATNETTTFAWNFNKINAKYVRYKIVSSAATNTVIIKQKKTAVM